MLHAKCYILYTTCYITSAKSKMLHATCLMLHNICSLLHTTCYMPHATCYILHVMCYKLCATCYVLHATWFFEAYVGKSICWIVYSSGYMSSFWLHGFFAPIYRNQTPLSWLHEIHLATWTFRICILE